MPKDLKIPSERCDLHKGAKRAEQRVGKESSMEQRTWEKGSGEKERRFTDRQAQAL